MRAALLTQYRHDVSIGTVPHPTITSPNDVIVRVDAAGFCRTDIHLWDGQFDAMQKGAGVDLPFGCGHETAGWVAEVGNGVTHVAVGDAVLLHSLATCGYCKACRSGDDMHCPAEVFPGVLAPGGFAEFVKTNARAVVPLKGSLTPVDVAPLGDAGLTAYRAVRKALPLAVPGTRTVVLGPAASGTSASRRCAHCRRPRSSWSTATPRRSSTPSGGARTTSSSPARTARTWPRCATSPTAPAPRWSSTTSGRAAPSGTVSSCSAPTGSTSSSATGARSRWRSCARRCSPRRASWATSAATTTSWWSSWPWPRRAISLPTTTFPLQGVDEALHALDEGRMIGRGVLVRHES